MNRPPLALGERERLIVALDEASGADALAWVDRLGDAVRFYKIGMELLATVDWLLAREGVAPTVPAVREGLLRWQGGPGAAARKDRLFDDRALGIALNRLATT